MPSPYSFVVYKDAEDNLFMGMIKEGRPGLHWFKGDKKEGLEIINRDNVFDLIKMEAIEPEFEESLCGKDNCFSEGLYLKEGSSRKYEKVNSFTILFEEVNGELVGDIVDVNPSSLHYEEESAFTISNNKKKSQTTRSLKI